MVWGLGLNQGYIGLQGYTGGMEKGMETTRRAFEFEVFKGKRLEGSAV